MTLEHAVERCRQETDGQPDLPEQIRSAVKRIIDGYAELKIEDEALLLSLLLTYPNPKDKMTSATQAIAYCSFAR